MVDFNKELEYIAKFSAYIFGKSKDKDFEMSPQRLADVEKSWEAELKRFKSITPYKVEGTMWAKEEKTRVDGIKNAKAVLKRIRSIK